MSNRDSSSSPFSDTEVFASFSLAKARTELLQHRMDARGGMVLDGEPMSWSWLVLPMMPSGEIRRACPHLHTIDTLTAPNSYGEVCLTIRCEDCGRVIYSERSSGGVRWPILVEMSDPPAGPLANLVARVRRILFGRASKIRTEK